MAVPLGEFCAGAAPADAASAMPMLTIVPTTFRFMRASLLTHRPAAACAPSGSTRCMQLLRGLQRRALDDLDPRAPGIGDVGDDVAGGGTLAGRLVELDAVRLERLEEGRMVLHVEADVIEHAMARRRLRRVRLGEADLAARD